MNYVKRKTIIFDLDGTLYSFKKGSYETSDLHKYVMSNAVFYIKEKLKISNDSAQDVLKKIINIYKQEISIGLEKEFGFDRYEYFNKVWNINPKFIIVIPKDLRKNLLKIKTHYEILLLSDAPKIWIKNVLNYLKINDLFKDKVISGEGSVRKSFDNAFKSVIKKNKLKRGECIVVGDQEETDIIPAKKMGIRTIFINQKYKSKYADFSVENITQAFKILSSDVFGLNIKEYK